MKTLTHAQFRSLTPDQRAALELTRRVHVARARQIHELTFRVPKRREALRSSA